MNAVKNDFTSLALKWDKNTVKKYRNTNKLFHIPVTGIPILFAMWWDIVITALLEVKKDKK
jgi:hypothetical protein